MAMDGRGDAALSSYRRRSTALLLVGVLATLVGITLVVQGQGKALGVLLLSGSVLVVGGGLIAVTRAIRMRRLVAAHGWRRRLSHYGVRGSGKTTQAALLLPATDAEPEAVLQVPTVRWRLRAFNDTSYLWVTGDLDTKFAAVLTPDLGSVFVVKASHYPPRRAMLREIAVGGDAGRTGKPAGRVTP
jgi:hypothetical protein